MLGRWYNIVMNIRYATDPEIADWNDIINQNPSGGNILQGKEFIIQKIEAGWTPRYILDDQCALAVIEKSIPLLGKVWYCPKGPGVTTHEQLAALLPELGAFARTQGVFTIKIEPEIDHSVDISDLELIKTRPVQANISTVLIDLSPDLDTIMKNFNQKGRHALRRAERDGVVVKKVEVSDETCRTMYELLSGTSAGAGFAIRSPEYYRRFYERYEDNGGLFFAYAGGQPVAGAFAMVQGAKSMYKDGASVRERPVYGASHLLQWEVIKWAKAKGSTEHDLAGVPPIAQLKNPDHPYYGIGRFKTSFNKTVTEFVGAYEVPVQPLKAKLWSKFIEKVVRRLYFKVHGESYY